MKIFEEVVTVKFRGSFTRPLHSSTRTSCTGMPVYLDKKYLSKDIRQYNDGRVRCRVSSTNGLEVFLEGWISFDVQERTGRRILSREVLEEEGSRILIAGAQSVLSGIGAR